MRKIIEPPRGPIKRRGILTTKELSNLKGKKIRIVAFTIVFNEEEIIEKCLKNTREQGLIPIVIDNGCTDGTIGIVKNMGIPVFECKTEKYHVYLMIERGIARARKVGCDWYVLKDADEIFETYNGRKVIEVVNEADNAGYNCMRFDMYEFWPTVDDDLSIADFTERIKHYSYYGSDYLKMIKNSPEIYTRDPHRPGRGSTNKESPTRLLFRHYKFTGLEQGKKKARNRLIIKRCATKKRHHHRFYDFAGRKEFLILKGFDVPIDENGFYVLEKRFYSKLHKFDGTWNKERVFDGWRGYWK